MKYIPFIFLVLLVLCVVRDAQHHWMVRWALAPATHTDRPASCPEHLRW